MPWPRRRGSRRRGGRGTGSRRRGVRDTPSASASPRRRQGDSATDKTESRGGRSASPAAAAKRSLADVCRAGRERGVQVFDHRGEARVVRHVTEGRARVDVAGDAQLRLVAVLPPLEPPKGRLNLPRPPPLLRNPRPSGTHGLAADGRLARRAPSTAARARGAVQSSGGAVAWGKKPSPRAGRAPCRRSAGTSRETTR